MTQSDNTALTIELKDGRKLGYAEFGDPNGKPIIHFNGFPGSRLEIKLMEDQMKGKGVRFIGVDRPGMGLSDFKKGRKFLDWPDDVIELADALGFDRFAVSGASGGGPYSLVCAYKIPERLTYAGVICGIGPPEFTKEGMMDRNVRDFEMFSWLIKILIKFKTRSLRNVEKAKKDILSQMDRYPESDREWLRKPEIIQALAEEIAEGARQGSKGLSYEFMLYRKPWGFKLEDISPNLKVIIWQGEKDVNVPVAMVREVVKLIPNCEGKFFPNDGHYSVIFNNFDDVIQSFKS